MKRRLRHFPFCPSFLPREAKRKRKHRRKHRRKHTHTNPHKHTQTQQTHTQTAILRAWAAEELNATTPEALAALPPVFVSSAHVDEPTFVRVYRSVDALVVPTHGEGWGRPQMEAMAMELPVISTNW